MSPKCLQFSFCLIALFLLWGCQSSQNAKLDFSDGSYEGEINKDGKKNGFGIYRWLDGSFYEGQYQNDLRHGKGRFLWANGESYDGEYLKDERTGNGIYDWNDSSKYHGEFLSGKRHGIGTYESAGGVVYKGEWFDDLQHGKGTLTYPDGRTKKGVWRKGALVSTPAALPSTSNKPVLPNIESVDQPAVPPSPKNKKNDPLKSQAENTESKNSKEVENSTGLDNPVISGQPDKIPNPPVPNQENTENPISENAPEPDQTVEQPDEKISKEEHSEEPDWIGTVTEAEASFITVLIDGIDTVRERSSGTPFTGSMRIVDLSGKLQGEVNLLNGRLHGKEVFYDENEEIVEVHYWSNGRPKKP